MEGRGEDVDVAGNDETVDRVWMRQGWNRLEGGGMESLQGVVLRRKY